jgi:asparagine synthetase B (glutamine-hydrolysing)
MRATIGLTPRGIGIIGQRVRASKLDRFQGRRWTVLPGTDRVALSEDDGATQPIVDTPESVIVRRLPRTAQPIYYRIDFDFLEIDHDLKRLAGSAGGTAGVDRSSLLHFMWRGRPCPGRTFYEGIRSLGVGEEIVCLPEQRPLVRRYWWPLHGEPLNDNESGLANDALSRIQTAVMRDACGSRGAEECDAPPTAAVLLSGGIDSGLIAAVGQRAGIPLTAYTVAFDESYGLNETDFAKRVAGTLRVPHRIVRVGVKCAKRLLSDVLESPQPRAAPAAVTTAALVEAVKCDGHDTLFSGLGADECFGGYHKTLQYFAAQVHQMRRKRIDLVGLFSLPLALLLRMREVLFFGVAEFFTMEELARIAQFADASILRELCVTDLEFYRGALAAKPDASPLELMAAHEYQYRLSELLLPAFRIDGHRPRPSIAYPFLDPSVYLWASTLGAAHCYWYTDGAWWAKRLLRASARRFLPEAIVMRKRQVLLAPLANWLTVRSFRSIVVEEIADSPFWDLGLLRKRARIGLVAKLRRYREPDVDTRWQEQLWVLLVLCAWTNRHESAVQNQ